MTDQKTHLGQCLLELNMAREAKAQAVERRKTHPQEYKNLQSEYLAGANNALLILLSEPDFVSYIHKKIEMYGKMKLWNGVIPLPKKSQPMSDSMLVIIVSPLGDIELSVGTLTVLGKFTSVDFYQDWSLLEDVRQYGDPDLLVSHLVSVLGEP